MAEHSSQGQQKEGVPNAPARLSGFTLDGANKPVAEKSRRSKRENEQESESSEPKKKRNRGKKPKGMPKRPLSAYNMFFKEERVRYLAKKPETQNPSNDKRYNFCVMGKSIGASWRALDSQGRQKYEQLAKQDMQRYRAEMETYHAHLLNTNQRPREEEEAEQHRSSQNSSSANSLATNGQDHQAVRHLSNPSHPARQVTNQLDHGATAMHTLLSQHLQDREQKQQHSDLEMHSAATLLNFQNQLANVTPSPLDSTGGSRTSSLNLSNEQHGSPLLQRLQQQHQAVQLLLPAQQQDIYPRQTDLLSQLVLNRSQDSTILQMQQMHGPSAQTNALILDLLLQQQRQQQMQQQQQQQVLLQAMLSTASVPQGLHFQQSSAAMPNSFPIGLGAPNNPFLQSTERFNVAPHGGATVQQLLQAMHEQQQ